MSLLEFLFLAFDWLIKIIMAHSSRHELTRYIRLFCSRSLQAIVQSRLKAPDSETRESKAKPDTPVSQFILETNQ